MMNVKGPAKLLIFFFLTISTIFLLTAFFCFSCGSSKINEEAYGKVTIEGSSITNKNITNETVTNETVNQGGINTAQSQDSQIYFFDYTKITLDATQSIDLKISNCNLYQDIYGDMLIMGEVMNTSFINKTSLELTFDFYNKEGQKISAKTAPAYVNYLDAGNRMPFFYCFEERDKYINVSKVRIGINYKNYNENFLGRPEITEENFHYDQDFLIIEGKVINIGINKIENLKLFTTFFNNKNQVVFIKQCYIQRESLSPLEQEDFELKVLLDEYLQPFTHYSISPFFKDSLKL